MTDVRLILNGCFSGTGSRTYYLLNVALILESYTPRPEPHCVTFEGSNLPVSSEIARVIARVPVWPHIGPEIHLARPPICWLVCP